MTKGFPPEVRAQLPRKEPSNLNRMDLPLREAIATAGGMRALARQIGISSQAITQWDRVPGERVVAVENATGIPRARLRPDLYGAPASPSVSSQPKKDVLARRVAARALHSALAHNPDLLTSYDANLLERRIARFLAEELQKTS
jgi:DNA-binding transcriptional regulator YdaS (Cro superfamily)